MKRFEQRGPWRRFASALLVAAVAATATTAAIAQDPSAGTAVEGSPGLTPSLTPSLTVRTNPPGATVVLDGPYKLVGVSPWTIGRDLSGTYRVEIRAPGYETWRGETVLAPGIGSTLSVNLSRKSRLKAIGQSLLLPGWGQSYLGERGKARTYYVLTGLTGAGWLTTHLMYQSKVDDFDRAAERYRAARTVDELPELRAKLREADRDADRAYDRRQIATYALVGVYGLSVLDAMVLSPISGPDRGLALEVGGLGDGGRVALALSW